VGRGTNLCPFRAVTFLLLRLLISSTHGYLDKVTTVAAEIGFRFLDIFDSQRTATLVDALLETD
jgi:hypothetical protein